MTKLKLLKGMAKLLKQTKATISVEEEVYGPCDREINLVFTVGNEKIEFSNADDYYIDNANFEDLVVQEEEDALL